MRDIVETDVNVRYDPGAEAYRGEFDPESVPVSDAVVSVTADVSEREPEDLEAIKEVVDPIVFDALVRRDRRRLQCRFTYAGYEVTVMSDGTITVVPDESNTWEPRQPEQDPCSNITSEAEFRRALLDLIDQARLNGVDVRGGWDCRYDADRRDYDVEITELSN